MSIRVPRGASFYIVPCGRGHSTSRYRAFALKEQIGYIGCDAYIVYRSQLSRIPPGNIVILQRVMPTAHRLEDLMKKSRYVMFDLDDYLVDSGHIPEGTNRSLDFSNSVVQTVKRVHGVMCSTVKLADVLSEELGVDTFVRRNYLMQDYGMIRNYTSLKRNLQSICYSAGSATHDVDFQMIEEPLAKVMEKNTLARLVILGYNVVSPVFKKTYRSRLIHRPFMSFKDYLRYLASQVTVAVAPLVDSKFNQCKSYAKALEAACVGVPVVCSPVGEYGVIIKNNVTGFIAETPEEWVKYLNHILDNPDERRRLGKEALAKAYKNFTSRNVADLEKVFDFTVVPRRRRVPTISTQPPAVITRPKRRLRVLTYRWHCGHQWELWHLAHDFTLAEARHSMKWDFHMRPLRPNAKPAPEKKLTLGSFDFALLHFDEHVLSPHKTQGFINPYWGEQFQHYVKELKIPKVAICHGTPPRFCRFDPEYEGDPWEVDDEERLKLVDFVGDMLVICNSRTAQKEWGFANSKVVYHGFDVKEYPQSDYSRGALCGSGDLHKRPWYRGWPYVRKLLDEGVPFDHLGQKGKLPLKSVTVPSPKGVGTKPNVFAEAKFWNYKKLLASYRVFFNPTWFSPMPRTRAEAMMCGCCLVTTAFQDEDTWIENGTNGFASNNVNELIGFLQYLEKNPEVAKTVGRQARHWAARNFSRARFLSQWRDIISGLSK